MECRNISCTSTFSKFLEGQVLLKLRGELIPDPNQYGGKPKWGVEHMFVDLWEKILTSLEGGSNASILLGIDYEKALNRMEHAVCLEQLECLGASPGSISLVRAFLEEWTMTIVVDGDKACPVAIHTGSPQGSELGCLLYCITTQALTAGFCAPGPQAVYFPQDPPGAKPVEMWATDTVDRTNGVGAFLYVDDTTLVNTVPMESATRHFTTNVTVETLSDPVLERAFCDLEVGADAIGMKINKKKTQLLAISPNNGCSTEIGDEEVTSQTEMELVGFTFGNTPNVGSHVAQIRDRFRVRIWMLYHLRRAGFRDRKLYRLYCCYLRTVIEYCSVVYHSLLTKGQAEELERIHRQAIRICYGNNDEVCQVMPQEEIETLHARQLRRCDGFIRKAAVNPTFKSKSFQASPMSGHWLRQRRRVFKPRAGTVRMFNSPLSYMRRRANQLGIGPG